MRILIAHDWALVRAGLSQILCDEFGPVDLTQVSTAAEARDEASGPWDLALVGVDAADSSGARFIAGLQRAHPCRCVLAVSRRAMVSNTQRTLKDLIQGTLARESGRDEIVKVVRQAITGGADGGLKRRWLLPGTPVLSRREFEVLRLFAAGKTIKEIAAQLRISASTIGTYRFRILRKLKLSSTAALIRYAFKSHLAD